MLTGSFKLIVVQAVLGTLFASVVLGCRKQSISMPDTQVLEAWDEANSPVLMGVKSKTFGLIAREGALPEDRYPWTDDYWATFRGGIALRWQKVTDSTKNGQELNYPLFDLKRLKNLSQAELDQLSPAEKYDLAYGRYDFPLVKQQWDEARELQREMGKIPPWYGICHGWAAASLAEPEPGEKASIVNPDGLRVNFFASDIKALMSKVYADGHHAETLVGKRCSTLSHEISTDLAGRVVLPECRDLNPAALHLILAQNLKNKNPLIRRGFIMDIAGDVEVWNQPVVGFKVLSSRRRVFDREIDLKKQYNVFLSGFIFLLYFFTRLQSQLKLRS
jgi:hypothetical protein